MNIEAYISSGILEAYALGELSEKDRVEVEQNLMQFPALRHELAQIEEAQQQLLLKASVQPRPHVKTALETRLNARPPDTPVVQMLVEDKKVAIWRLAAAAAATVALISSYFAYDYWNEWKSSENDLSELRAQNLQMAKDNDQVKLQLGNIDHDLKIINNPAFNRVIMISTTNASTAGAVVYWNANTNEVFLTAEDMKTLSRENQYQLWAIIGGKPVDAGVFDGNVTGLLKMKSIAPGVSAFAVTVEPRGGSESPSLETMQATGNIVKG